MQTATNRAVEVHDASRLLETQGQILPLSDGMLHQLCKSGGQRAGRREGMGGVVAYRILNRVSVPGLAKPG